MRYVCLSLLISYTLSIEAQDNGITLKTGYSVPFAPYGIYSDDISSLYANNDFTFYPGNGYGLNLETVVKSGKPLMSYIAGAFYHYSGRYDNYEDDQQMSEAWMYLTGAGIYGGLSFNAGWEHFGIFNSYTFGFFSFDYRLELQYTSKLGVVPVSDKGGEAVSGPGGKFELGLYGSFKRFSIYPAFSMIYTSNRQSQAVLIKSFNISAGYSF